MHHGVIHSRTGAAGRTAPPVLAMLSLLVTAGCGAGGIGRVYGPGRFPTAGATDGGASGLPSGSIASQDFSPAPQHSAPAVPTPTSEVVPQVAYKLRKKLIPMPSSAHPWPAGEVGAFGLNGFISRFYITSAQAREKRIAQERHFIGAARTGWFNGDGSQEGVFLVEFAQDSGAENMFESLSLGWQQDSALTTFSDGEVQGQGAVTTTPDHLGNIDVRIVFYVNDTLGEVHYWARTADKDAARAAALAQYQALF